jgi:hypothetical protein
MGQPITVVETRSSNPALLRFETNRPLSGMGHEHYDEPPDALAVRPVDELARRLFDAGGVAAVHINSSVVTVTLSAGSTGAGLADVIRSLFLHYPATLAEPAAPELTDAEAAPETTADPAEATTETVDAAPAPTGEVAEAADAEPAEGPEVIVDPALEPDET